MAVHTNRDVVGKIPAALDERGGDADGDCGRDANLR
jgi:hypothetical protein